MKKDDFTKPVVKIPVIVVLTTIISIFVSSLGDWDPSQDGFTWKIVFLALSVIAYIAAMIFFATEEINQRRALGIYKSQVNTFENLMIGIISICGTNASDINKLIHNINETKTIDRTVWNFDRSCMAACEHIYNNICELGGSKKYEVAYVKLVENDFYQNKVQMIAYANQNMHKPSVYNKKRLFKGIETSSAFHDLCLFHKAKSDNDIRFTKEEVNEVFQHSSKGNENIEKYQFYIGIPVFCDNRKMVGLLEVVGFDDTKLGCLTRQEMEEKANKYLVPYANMILLLHKMEKALFAGTAYSV